MHLLAEFHLSHLHMNMHILSVPISLSRVKVLNFTVTQVFSYSILTVFISISEVVKTEGNMQKQAAKFLMFPQSQQEPKQKKTHPGPVIFARV